MLSRSKTQAVAKNKLYTKQNRKSEHALKRDPDQVAEKIAQS